MQRRAFRARYGAAAALAVLVAFSTRADEPTVERIDTVPEGIAAGIASVLAPDGMRVEMGGRTIVEFHFRSGLPGRKAGDGGLGVAFGGIVPGTLVGVARFPNGWSDYRGHSVEAGTYTLRYALQPADGNHMGTSMYRDYLLLVPADADPDVESSWTGDELARRSAAATPGAHPGAMALFPVYEIDSLPGLVRNELDQWMLAAQVGSVRLGLVVRGKAEAEGY